VNVHWDWTITAGNIIQIIWFTIVIFGASIKIYTKVVRYTDKLQLLMDEYPPHRHVSDQIVYPAGMKPQD